MSIVASPQPELEAFLAAHSRAASYRASRAVRRTRVDHPKRAWSTARVPGSTKKRSPRVVIPRSTGNLPATRGLVDHVRTELIERMSAMEGRLKAEIHEVKAEVHEVKALQSRLVVLVEQQDARNAVVFEALQVMIDRQDRHDERFDRLEDTVRAIATPRR